MKVARGRLYVAGGATGDITVYNLLTRAPGRAVLDRRRRLPQ